ncbi:MAG: hypothetical protein AB1772_02685 [Candidatus Zixiibacteriota bacterium]
MSEKMGEIMLVKSRAIGPALIVIVATAGLYFGWKLFWFMTDDAMIAFRYVSNSVLGHGYVWNPPPFLPVEGYTSFLWVALLDVVWRLFGVEPPDIANTLSLVFSFATIVVTAWFGLRMSLTDRLEKYRLGLIALALAGMLTNRTFLAWTSSGLETALFNFLFLLWIGMTVIPRRRGTVWILGMTLVAALLHLSRPDGLLILVSTLLLVGHRLAGIKQEGRLRWKTGASLSPLLIPFIHLGWRRLTYGEWLPNTYYAKYTAPWPEAGIRYLASFVLEFGLWLWLALLVWLGILWMKKEAPSAAQWRTKARAWLSSTVADRSDFGTRRLALVIVLGTIAAHIAYYTLLVGGDHFEYRVFSYLVPLIFLSFIWMINRLLADAWLAGCVLALFLAVSWPIQWVHWLVTKDYTARGETWIMFIPVAPEFPAPVRWYAQTFDELQFWLIKHHVCMRHQEHKVFYEYFKARFPERSLASPPLAGEFPIAAFQSVGVPGWVFPKVAIIDAFGLNDYVIARHKVKPHKFRLMAHDRYPPKAYLESFSLNYGMMSDETAGFYRREYEITPEDIRATEQYWIDRVVHGIERPFSYSMLNRIGESLVRTDEADSATVYLRQAIALEPNQVRAYVNLARCFDQEDQLDSVRHHLLKAYELAPDDPLVLTRLGKSYALTGYDNYESDSAMATAALEQAERLLHKALRIDTTLAEALVELASIDLFLDRIESSITYLQKLESHASPQPSEVQVLAYRYAYKQHRELAVRAFRLAIHHGLDPSMARILVDLYPELADTTAAAGAVP